jgi:hypothetical protein
VSEVVPLQVVEAGSFGRGVESLLEVVQRLSRELELGSTAASAIELLPATLGTK